MSSFCAHPVAISSSDVGETIFGDNLVACNTEKECNDNQTVPYILLEQEIKKSDDESDTNDGKRLV